MIYKHIYLLQTNFSFFLISVSKGSFLAQSAQHFSPQRDQREYSISFIRHTSGGLISVDSVSSFDLAQDGVCGLFAVSSALSAGRKVGKSTGPVSMSNCRPVNIKGLG
jgi:hypothetical protein